MHPVIVIFAPTASGKTALARSIFGRSSLSIFKNRGEVISADSQAVYKGLDIGTAKPTPEEQQDIPHHLVDIISPEVQFGTGDFISRADKTVKMLWDKNKIPVVCGGTGFYIRNFLLGLPVTPESKPEIREMLKQRLEKEGNKQLYWELKQIDPEYAKKISINDAYRICRALEVYYSSGKPLSSFKMPERLREGFDFLTIILQRDKEELYQRIDSRVDLMFEMGLEKEVEELKKLGYNENTPGMKAIGYSEFFIPGLTTEEIREKIKLNSRKYAKKQYTFMRGIPGAVTINVSEEKDLEAKVTSLITEFLSQHESAVTE